LLFILDSNLLRSNNFTGSIKWFNIRWIKWMIMWWYLKGRNAV
jgi:hypothetical protein